MAYNFENKQAENDFDVELYLNEGMFFEAWTMIIRHWTGDFDELHDQLEKEANKKSTKLTDDDVESLYVEFLDCRSKAEDEAYIMGGGFLSPSNLIFMEA